MTVGITLLVIGFVFVRVEPTRLGILSAVVSGLPIAIVTRRLCP